MVFFKEKKRLILKENISLLDHCNVYLFTLITSIFVSSLIANFAPVTKVKQAQSNSFKTSIPQAMKYVS